MALMIRGQHELTPQETEAAQAALAAEALPLLGVLRKGAPMESYVDKKDGKTKKKAGRELPYFRMDWRPGYEYLAPEFEDIYGAEPVRIPGVQLIGARPFQACFETWHGNQTLKARHNGQVWIKRWTDQGYSFEPDPIDVDMTLAAECVPVGRLFFWLPELAARTFEIGKFIAITTSPNDCQQLDAYVKMGRRLVPIYQTAFELFREPRDFTVPIKGKPSKTTKHMVRIRIQPESARAALAGPDATYLDEVTGEIIHDLPAGEPEQEQAPERWAKAEAMQAAGYGRSQGLTDAQTLDALGVVRFGDWPDTLIAAYDAIDTYIEVQLQNADMDALGALDAAQQQDLFVGDNAPVEPVQYE